MARDPHVIPASHWLHPALWFDLKTGDVVQERDSSEDEVDHYRFDDGRDNYTVDGAPPCWFDTAKSVPTCIRYMS